MDALALARLQLRTLYRFDERGRMLGVNDIGDAASRRFAMVRTAAGSVFALAHDLEPQVASELEAMARSEPITADWEREPPGMLEPALRLLKASPASVRGWRGPAFVALDDPSPQVGEACVHEMAVAEAHLLHPELSEWTGDIAFRWPAMVAFVDGAGVAICASARFTPRAAEAGLETAVSFRRRELGAAVSAAWIRTIRRSGRTAFYSTEWENAGSRGVARKLGLTAFGEDVHIV